MAQGRSRRSNSKGQGKSKRNMASRKVRKAMREMKSGTLRSGRSGKRVSNRKQAIAIGLSEARRSGARIPRRSSGKGRR